MWRRLKRIPDLAIAVKLRGDDDACVAQVGKLKFDSIDVAMCCRPEVEGAEPSGCSSGLVTVPSALRVFIDFLQERSRRSQSQKGEI